VEREWSVLNVYIYIYTRVEFTKTLEDRRGRETPTRTNFIKRGSKKSCTYRQLYGADGRPL